MTPKALAEATSVSTDTLRHYERLGLLAGITRTRAGYRCYPENLIWTPRVKWRGGSTVVRFIDGHFTS